MAAVPHLGRSRGGPWRRRSEQISEEEGVALLLLFCDADWIRLVPRPLLGLLSLRKEIVSGTSLAAGVKNEKNNKLNFCITIKKRWR